MKTHSIAFFILAILMVTGCQEVLTPFSGPDADENNYTPSTRIDGNQTEGLGIVLEDGEYVLVDFSSRPLYEEWSGTLSVTGTSALYTFYGKTNDSIEGSTTTETWTIDYTGPVTLINGAPVTSSFGFDVRVGFTSGWLGFNRAPAPIAPTGDA